MISLFLNTSSNFLNIGLLKDNILLDEVYKQLDRDLSKETLYLIKETLDKHKLKPQDIDKIICVKGPGSFTGLRVGVTIAKTMAYFLEKKLYSTSSLNVMATSVNKPLIVPVIDARRGYVYAAIYDENYNILMNECYIKLNELIEKVESYNKEYVIITNDELEITTEKFKPNLQNFIEKGIITKEDPMSFIPNYLKRPEAEEKLNDKTNNK